MKLKLEAKLDDDYSQITELKVNRDEKEPRKWLVRAHGKSQIKNIIF